MKNEDLIYDIWLSRLKGIGPALSRSLLSYFSSAQNIYTASADVLMSCYGIGETLASTIVSSKDLTPAQIILDNCNRKEIRITTISDSTYPKSLRDISDIPIALYYKGTLKNTESCAGIVGPRRCNQDSKQLTIKTALSCIKCGQTIVSGMAFGTDAYAHTAAIKNNGYTIAVLGCSTDICYPKEHIELYEAIIRHGCILSAYPPGTEPQTFYFPERNKIIAGLSDKLYVINPRRGSGSLITAEYAKKYGKEVSILRPEE